MRGFGPELEERLLRAAAADNLSLNQAALRFLERGAGLSERRAKLDTIGSSLDGFIGGWTKKQADEVLGRTPIPTNDVWIAAHAMETGSDLISFDRHFAHVPGLAWVLPGT